ncbi:mycofactocin-coupled SDR family oxidoreductase [Nocardia speluncae]|uniref:Mycofactocin-coupled SDR family oxidoreductase n=1 Tax=Nocardia speluncae TaxID=419477 RepID=A0A846X6U9_9NOCA|nr:mycofactocin-coupled SDR family oxidoreductase [Nocardia speluncae]NKY31871.1 mycofactocin-coupled SDR family oxidoreductase [Nocardia speluncae]
MGTLDGQIAFVTGGARGQGRSHAVHLASLGADIVIVDSLKDNDTTEYPMAGPADLDETVRLVRAQGRDVYTRQIDVRDFDGLVAFADEVVDKFGKIDILLANAGIMTAVEISEMSPQVWAETIDINLTGVFNSFRAVLPHMIAAGYGRVVATSSGGGHIGFNNLGHYCASKWGVIGLVKSAAMELAGKGITVNAVTPTNVNTDMIRNPACEALFLPGVDNPSEQQIRDAYVINPMGVPWIEPIDVSRTIAFLVSPDSTYITGETLGPLAGSGATNGAA